MTDTLKSPTPQAKRQNFSEFLESLDYGGISEKATNELNELVRPHKVIEAAVKDLREKIAADTGLNILVGSPA